MELEKKYKSGKINSEELSCLRKQLQSESDDTIAARMELEWLEEDMDLSAATPEILESLLMKVHRHIRTKKVRRIAAWTVIATAVALIPICIGVSSYFIHQTKVQSEQRIAISTGRGEQSTVTLPDGTVVRLNSFSELSYFPGAIQQKERRISFHGEAFFEVAHDEEHPFIIDADRMKVSVLGTKFNLKSRTEESHNSLLLLEGLVALESELTGEIIELSPGEEAIMDKESMTFTISRKKDFSSALGWQDKELIVKNITLSELFTLLEKTYGVSINRIDVVEDGDLFTGTLPSNDLPSCIEIIEYAYGLRLNILDDKVEVFSKKSG